MPCSMTLASKSLVMGNMPSPWTHWPGHIFTSMLHTATMKISSQITTCANMHAVLYYNHTSTASLTCVLADKTPSIPTIVIAFVANIQTHVVRIVTRIGVNVCSAPRITDWPMNRQTASWRTQKPTRMCCGVLGGGPMKIMGILAIRRWQVTTEYVAAWNRIELMRLRRQNGDVPADMLKAYITATGNTNF